MIPVRVGDEHSVHIREPLGGDGCVAPEVKHTPAQHRVGEQPNTVELQQNGRMTDVGDARHVHRNLLGAVVSSDCG